MSKASDLRIVEAASKDVDELHSRISSEVGISEAKHARGDRRHAELAALVQEVTVALETLERKVATLVELELKVLTGVDPPDIKDTPSVDWVRGPRGGVG